MPRMFIAVEPAAAVKTALAALRQGSEKALRADIPGCKWVRPEQLHLTLRFLDDVSPGAAKALGQALGEIRLPPFEMRISGVGTFPGLGGRQHPRVLWAGIENSPQLQQLWRAVNEAANASKLGGDETGRPFSPHITIARLKECPPSKLSALIRRHEGFAAPPMPVREFVLFESELRREGAVHTAVQTFALRA